MSKSKVFYTSTLDPTASDPGEPEEREHDRYEQLVRDALDEEEDEFFSDGCLDEDLNEND